MSRSNAKTESDLPNADCNKNLETVRRLIDTFPGHKGCLSASGKQRKRHINPNDSHSEKCWTLLHLAAVRKEADVAELLISNGADVNAKDRSDKTPIHYAIENIDAGFTELLLRHGACLKKCPGLIQTAVKVESREIVAILLNHDIGVINSADEHGRTALHYTALRQSLKTDDTTKRSADDKAEIAELLLKRGANINARTREGLTALHVAAESGRTRALEILLDFDADVNSVADFDRTPLHCAAENGNQRIAQVLLENGADVNAKQRDGRSALHVASEKGHAKMVEMLLDYGAAIDSSDMYGRTALHDACINAKIQAVLVLLACGADVNIRCKDFSTPLDYANLPELFAQFPEEMTLFFIDRLSNCSNLNDYKEVTEILEQQIIKMKAIGLFVSEHNLLSIDTTSDNYRKFYDCCKKEIESLRITKIGDTNVSFYDILTKATDQVSVYSANESVEQALNSNSYKETFPIYSNMIRNHFKKGQRRKDLLHSGMNSLNAFIGYPIPNILSTKILSLLNNENLRNLIKACSKQI